MSKSVKFKSTQITRDLNSDNVFDPEEEEKRDVSEKSTMADSEFELRLNDESTKIEGESMHWDMYCMIVEEVERGRKRMEEEDPPSREIFHLLQEEEINDLSFVDLLSVQQQETKSPVPQSVQVSSCLVCGDRSTGYHYGVSTCEGCKCFFKRSAFKSFSCKKDKYCIINRVRRKKCRHCRLKKCVDAGMIMPIARMGSLSQLPIQQPICTFLIAVCFMA